MAQPMSLSVEGQEPTISGMHAALVASATAHIHDLQHAECRHDTPLLFARMDCHGVGEDINNAVRMLAVAVVQRRQLVLLPPPPEFWHDPAKCALPPTVRLSATEPWHWVYGQKFPLSSILHLSACHEELLQNHPKLMEALALSPYGNLTQVAKSQGAMNLESRSRESRLLWRTHISVSRHVPRIFQRQGLLWWFQVLTTYLVRIQEPLSGMLASHPAMAPFMSSATTPPSATLDDLRWVGWDVRCAKTFCDGVGPGWRPQVRFDAGAHIRLGDSCRQSDLPKHYTMHVRRCDLNLSVAIRKLQEAGVRSGSLYIASDSQSVFDEVDRGGAHPFRATYLRINRSRYETAVSTERISAEDKRLNSFLEALMDMLLLSRSTLIAGKMMSNFPRCAIQMRVQIPRQPAGAYVSLDDRPWCTRTSCRSEWPVASQQAYANRREQQRTPKFE